MAQAFDTLDLIIELIIPPQNAPADVLAHVTVRCDALGHAVGVFTDPLTPQERADLRWYLETYPDWPFAEFATRGQQIEHQLPVIGKRLYQALFGVAQTLLTAWQLSPAQQKQIIIISPIPAVLSLPWELLHDEHGFLVLRTHQPVLLQRRLDQESSSALSTASFEPSLRILVVTPRPQGASFLDPRGLAHELLDAVQSQIDAGTITVELLRPPTSEALHLRLCDASRPVHLLHFDGHGVLKDNQKGETEGMLLFEDEQWERDPVSAKDLGQILLNSGVRLAALDACQSALSSEADAFSSVAGRLIQNGIDAILAMSASVRTSTSTRFFARFYRDLAAGISVPLAQEHARQELYDKPLRHLFALHPDEEEGQPILLRDWWLPHFYQQRLLTFLPTRTNTTIPTRKTKEAPVLPRFNVTMPSEPRYRFGGRAWELLQIERLLLSQHRLVILSGFGGIGKTALAREAAAWFTRTGLYQRACFVSFEHGGDAPLLLSELGTFLGVNDGAYVPQDVDAALARLQPVLQQHPILLIVDNLESLLPGGEAPLEQEERQQFWQTLLTLAEQGTGVLLTSRDPLEHEEDLATSAAVGHLPLEGLEAPDAYALASRLLTDLSIDRTRAPYADLRTLLAQLDYLPLAIQLVLPALRSFSLNEILTDFERLLPTFTDDTATGRQRSLLASLEYSLQHLSSEQRAFLPCLAVFAGGVLEKDLLTIAKIPEHEWVTLKTALIQAGLLSAEPIPGSTVPFLHFHPVLTPYLSTQIGAKDPALQQRTITYYRALALYLYEQYDQRPQAVRALFIRELPNLRRTLAHLLKSTNSDAPELATFLGDKLAFLLNSLGRWRERDALRRQLTGAQAQAPTIDTDSLTEATYLLESGLGEDEWQHGHLETATVRFTHLLARIEVQPAGTPHGPGSHAHCTTLVRLARCLEDSRDLSTAEGLYHRALAILDALLLQKPEDTSYLRLHSAILCDIARVLHRQGSYPQAREHYIQALALARQQADEHQQSVIEGLLGTLALDQGDLTEAQRRYQVALDTSQALGNLEMEAAVWHQLGTVAQWQQQWTEAERCYCESLAREEQLGHAAGIASTCNQLASVALGANRPTEAEAWRRRALAADSQANPGNPNTTYLRSLARLLVAEAQAGQAAPTRLVEAKMLAEQALVLEEGQSIAIDTWLTLETLADIAELEAQLEQAYAYRRRARTAYAAFPGNRYRLEQQMGGFIADVSAAAQGNEDMRQRIEAAFPQLEEMGWHLTSSIHRLWAGERDWLALTDGLDHNLALLILLVLEALASPVKAAATQPIGGDLLVDLPAPMRDAIRQDNQAAFDQAFAALAPEEQPHVLALLQALDQTDEDKDESAENP